MEPGGRDHGQLDIGPVLLGQVRLDELQLVQVGHALGRAVAQLATGNDAVARHDLAVLLDERDDVRVVQPEQAGVGILQARGAVKLVPHEAPEAGADELAVAEGAEAQVALQLDDLGNGLGLGGGQARGVLGLALANGLADSQQGLWPEQRAHVLGAERRSHDERRRGGEGAAREGNWKRESLLDRDGAREQSQRLRI